MANIDKLKDFLKSKDDSGKIKVLAILVALECKGSMTVNEIVKEVNKILKVVRDKLKEPVITHVDYIQVNRYLRGENRGKKSLKGLADIGIVKAPKEGSRGGTFSTKMAPFWGHNHLSYKIVYTGKKNILMFRFRYERKPYVCDLCIEEGKRNFFIDMKDDGLRKRFIEHLLHKEHASYKKANTKDFSYVVPITEPSLEASNEKFDDVICEHIRKWDMIKELKIGDVIEIFTKELGAPILFNMLCVDSAKKSVQHFIDRNDESYRFGTMTTFANSRGMMTDVWSGKLLLANRLILEGASILRDVMNEQTDLDGSTNEILITVPIVADEDPLNNTPFFDCKHWQDGRHFEDLMAPIIKEVQVLMDKMKQDDGMANTSETRDYLGTICHNKNEYDEVDKRVMTEGVTEEEWDHFPHVEEYPDKTIISVVYKGVHYEEVIKSGEYPLHTFETMQRAIKNDDVDMLEVYSVAQNKIQAKERRTIKE